MTSCRFAISLVVMLKMVFWAFPATGQAITPLSALHDIAEATPTHPPVRTKGTVTVIEPRRALIVLQSDVDAVALYAPALMNQGLNVGDQVELEGKFAPLVLALPRFPDEPDSQGIMDLFEAPMDQGNYHLSRLTGLLHPPVTGDYTFWIASDDASELRLSEGDDPKQARVIALVQQGRWTQPREWMRFPLQQQSQAIRLETGKAYYIEAIAQDAIGRDCLAVAWQGPGLNRAVIEGQYVTPFNHAESDMESAEQGVLWENWTNFYSSEFSALKLTDEHILKCQPAKILKRTPGELPDPIPISSGQEIGESASYRIIEIEGRVSFISRLDDGWLMELKHGDSWVSAQLESEAMPEGVIPAGSLMRVRGVFEPVRDTQSTRISGRIWVNSDRDIAWLDTDDNWSLLGLLPQHDLKPLNAKLSSGQMVRTQGRVLGSEAPNEWRVEGKDTFQGYTSPDGADWVSVGSPVELSMSEEVLVGFAVASHQNDDLANIELDHVSGLVRELTGANIGEPPISGSLGVDSGTIRVQGSGNDIWGLADQCFFAYETKKGSFQIEARLSAMESIDPQAKLVLMARESVSSNSAWAGLAVMSSDRSGLQARLGSGENAVGEILTRPQPWIKLVRQRNSFLIRTPESTLEPGQTLDIMGEVQWQDQELVLENVRTRLFLDAPETNLVAGLLDQPPSQIRTVPIAELASEANKARRLPYPVTLRVRGVVTYNGSIEGERITLVQDDSGGTRVQCRTEELGLAARVGDLVELVGSMVISVSMPEFVAGGIACIGTAEMPEPVQFSESAQLESGDLTEWVELVGVVRGVGPNGMLWVMSHAGLVEVHAESLPTEQLEKWVNALIRIRGALWRAAKNQMFLLPSKRFVEVLEAPPSDPFNIPLFPVSSVSSDTSLSGFVRRMKVSGVVTCCREEFIVLQDESGGVQLDIATPGDVAIGDRIEAVGFPSQHDQGVILSGSLLRNMGRSSSVEPSGISSGERIRPEDNGLLVSLEAVLLAQHSGGGVQTLDLQSGQRAFRASIPIKDGQVPRIAVGSRLRLTGVAKVTGAEAPAVGGFPEDRSLMGSFELLLRSPLDVIIVERPPWWNWKYTTAVIAAVFLGFIGAFLWIRTLHRQVDEQTHELRETMGKLQKETRISATLAERDRLAGEIHDSIEQGLSAIMMQMDAAAKLVNNPDEIKQYLSMARNMASFSRSEVQHAVWDMQSPLLENADLPTALRRIAGDISAGDAPRVQVEISGIVASLPSAVEHHLVRIAQEAMTNAVKHGNPSTIFLTLHYGPETVALTIRDNGGGFIPEAVSTDSGHFGLQGMRTRAQKIQAELNLTSKLGEGTCVEVVIPFAQS